MLTTEGDEPHERFDDFVTALKTLIKDCGYRDADRMLRDAIVLRSRDEAVRGKCLDEGDTLTLDKAIHIGQNQEVSKMSLREIRDGEDADVRAVHQGRKRYSKPGKNSQAKAEGQQKKCRNCGYSLSHDTCPAKDKDCNYCHKRGHFATVCRKKATDGKYKPASGKHLSSSAHQVEEEYPPEADESYSHLVSTVEEEELLASVDSGWWSEVSVQGKALTVQLDTGATRSVLPYNVYKELHINKPLRKSSCKLRSYTNHVLQVAGKVTLPTQYKDKTIDIEYQVVRVNQKPLLSGDACSRLGLIERINIIDQYPELCRTTGTLPGVYRLRIDPSVPPVVHAPRRQPRALVDKVVQNLHELEQEGHIANRGQNGNWAVLVFTDQCTLGGTGP